MVDDFVDSIPMEREAVPLLAPSQPSARSSPSNDLEGGGDGSDTPGLRVGVDANPAVMERELSPTTSPALFNDALVSSPRDLLVFFVGCVAMVGAGTLYSFGAYEDRLKDALRLTQAQVEQVGFIGDLGVYLNGPWQGAVADQLGPKKSCAIWAIALFVGYFGLSLATTSGPKETAAPAAVALFLAGVGSGGLYLTTLGTLVRASTPASRGRTIGLLVALYGLSAAICTAAMQAVPGLANGEVSKFLTFLAFFTSSTGAVAACVLPLAKVHATSSTPVSSGGDDTPASLFKSVVAPLLALLKDSRFLINFGAFFAACGAGLMLINNVGSWTRSMLASPDGGGVSHALVVKARLVVLISLANAGGRAAAGIVGDIVNFQRGYLVCFAGALLSAGFLAGIVGADSTEHATRETGLYLTALLVGFAYGNMWSITPAIVSELFGTRRFSTHWGWHIVAPAVAGSTMNAIAGSVYDAHAHSSDGGGGGLYCYGAQCYRTTLWLCAACGLVCALFGWSLGPYTKCSRRAALSE
ncbi:hypothetical protein PPROV_000249900 [Pycnococcus provasolii]|uniref:Nodulin-like domain-containing protein n=1 Tax=Pycnococcus provasolii TaxID=41880 RepID=A0A830H9I8_9CHLO|nr:hypothetical protein PPROV_000249900 [Pycnococcus provasolii]